MSKLNLDNITLLSYNNVNPLQSVKALLYSSKKIKFARMVLVSNKKPEKIPPEIEWIPTKGTSHKDSCEFPYKELPNIIKTEYYLGIHDDGFVINPHLWDNNWFNYDYIGAPWKNYGQINRVGNGGFVFKSNKFIQLTKHLQYRGTHDDGELTNDYYHFFTKCGCKYAPVEIAMKFSLESRIPECDYDINNCFGFHGRGNPNLISVHDGFYQQFQEKCKLLDEVEI